MTKNPQAREDFLMQNCCDGNESKLVASNLFNEGHFTLNSEVSL